MEAVKGDCMSGSREDGIKSEEELLALDAGSASRVYFGELYARYIPELYGVCLKYLHNADDASDAVMSLFEELSAKISRYEIKDFRSWLYTVAKNHCFQLLRRKRREIPFDDSAKVVEYASLVHLLNEGEGGRADKILEECLERLPARQRECIVKFFYDDKSYADISAETLYPLGSVKSYLQNGKRNLKICMEKHWDEVD